MSGLAERVEQVRLLLITMNDPYPQPRSALAPDAGPAPSRYVPCETCRETGWARARGGWMLCLICDGRGWKRREDEPEWDAYLSLPLQEAAQLPRESRGGHSPTAEVQEKTYGWERLLRAYDRHGSYERIRRELERLSRTHPRRHRLINRMLVLGEPRELSPASQLELELGVITIALRVGRVRVPPWLIERTSADERRSTIAGLLADGYSPAQISRRLGVSKRVVQRKLRG